MPQPDRADDHLKNPDRRDNVVDLVALQTSVHGEAVIDAAQLRGRCVMTTYDPDTLRQDLNVLKSIARELDGVMALD